MAGTVTVETDDAKQPMVIIPVAAILVMPGGSLRADDKKSICDAAITAYAANIHSFTHYQCRYSYAEAQVKSMEDAVQGEFINARSYDSRLLVDGDNDYHEELGPVEKPDPKAAQRIPGHEGLSAIDTFYRSGRYLSDGRREISIIPQFNTLSFHSGEGAHRGISTTPLGMHVIRHRGLQGPDARRARPDTFDMICDGLQEVDGMPLVTVRFRHKKHDSETKYSFDANRGFLPARMETVIDGKVSSRVFLTHAIELSGQRWFPKRSITVGMQRDNDNLYRVSELKALELDVDRRPPAEEFAMTVEAGTPVNLVDRPPARFVLRQQERISVRDLAKLESMFPNLAPKPLTDTAIPRPDRR
jgi:hypothetical protein